MLDTLSVKTVVERLLVEELLSPNVGIEVFVMDNNHMELSEPCWGILLKCPTRGYLCFNYEKARSINEIWIYLKPRVYDFTCWRRALEDNSNYFWGYVPIAEAYKDYSWHKELQESIRM